MNLTPGKRPQITRAELFSTYPRLNEPDAKLAMSKGVCCIIIAGYYAQSMGPTPGNDRGFYDDAMIVISDNVYATFNANTDPSAFRAKTADRQGMATLKPGIHPYKMGNHGQSRPGGGYPAFRPNTKDEALPVTRDGDSNKNAVGIAINIHKGGVNGTSSEGCQTIHPLQWETFYALVKGELARNRQKTFDLIKI